MKKRLLAASLILLMPAARVFAEDDGTGWLPRSHEVFETLLADSRELQYSVRLVAPVGERLLGEMAIGDYLGLYRWDLGGGGRAQFSVGGGAFARFKITSAANDMQVVDFYANAPFDIRVRKWSGRLMLYHTSSHLGDDFINDTGRIPSKHSWDNLRMMGSYDADAHWRLYGGYTFTFRELPGHVGRNALECGFEAKSAWWHKNHAQTYWANDLQTWERTNWNPMFTSQAGVKFVQDRVSNRGVSFFLEFMTGPQPHGQFFQEHETRYNLGVKFDLS